MGFSVNTCERRDSAIFAVAALVCVALLVGQVRVTRFEILWLASSGIPAELILSIVTIGPVIVIFAILYGLVRWPTISWYLYKKNQFRRTVAECSRRECELRRAGVTESAALVTILPTLTDGIYRADLGLFSIRSSPEPKAYRNLADDYIRRLKTIATDKDEPSGSRRVAIHASIKHLQAGLDDLNG
ncbi:hypothetical protein LFL96_36770 (plasmid) [Paraburkholderia sp. D15]|uniref:hypothetical protein n=1 Tax=Paraburkholderia sp. D15 TaxID=2880218 RepID=UPI00247965EA|nr:hypothetical protein [Paraburkholderia sp. D15]WGS55032.1 hypothetical protein LFL96_36770 [Paraburkholderia sp. D15]